MKVAKYQYQGFPVSLVSIFVSIFFVNLVTFRVIRDAGQLESEAQLLSAKLSAVRAEMEEVEAETKENMSSLVRMDTVKERLTATTRALQEADNWTSLDNQVEDAFDNNDHEAVAEKIVGMQQSLRLLHHVADYQVTLAEKNKFCCN